MDISRRNLFQMFAALPFIGTGMTIKSEQSPLRDAVDRGLFTAFPGQPKFYVGLNQRAKYRWVAADITRDRLEEWAKNHPWFLKRYKKEDIHE